MNVGEERFRGWLDIPLDPAGLRAAAAIGEQLREVPAEAVHTSDLLRARQTASAIGAAMAQAQQRYVPLLSTADLRPWNGGNLQGRAISDVRKIMRRYQQKQPDMAPPGGEPFTTFVTRFMGFWQRLLMRVGASNATTVVVTHNRNIRLVVAWLAAGGIGPDIVWSILDEEQDPVEPGGILVLSRETGGEPWQAMKAA